MFLLHVSLTLFLKSVIHEWETEVGHQEFDLLSRTIYINKKKAIKRNEPAFVIGWEEATMVRWNNNTGELFKDNRPEILKFHWKWKGQKLWKNWKIQ